MRKIFLASFIIALLPGWDAKNSCVKLRGDDDSEKTVRIGDVKRASNISHGSEREYRVFVKGIVFDRITQNPVVILLTEDRNRFVPIWIGFSEAMSIDMVMKNVKPPRPMTHDLMKDVIDKIGAKIEKVVISDMRENTYYAFIKLKLGDKTYTVDSRPSDAIALALRVGSPVFITQKILDVSVRIPTENIAETIWQTIGVSIQIITPELEGFFGSKGLVVSDVKKGSIADGKLQRGDVITHINGKAILDERSVSMLSAEITSAKDIEITILRNGERKTIRLYTSR